MDEFREVVIPTIDKEETVKALKLVWLIKLKASARTSSLARSRRENVRLSAMSKFTCVGPKRASCPRLPSVPVLFGVNAAGFNNPPAPPSERYGLTPATKLGRSKPTPVRELSVPVTGNSGDHAVPPKLYFRVIDMLQISLNGFVTRGPAD